MSKDLQNAAILLRKQEYLPFMWNYERSVKSLEQAVEITKRIVSQTASVQQGNTHIKENHTLVIDRNRINNIIIKFKPHFQEHSLQIVNRLNQNK